jgi:hypothetical protein
VGLGQTIQAGIGKANILTSVGDNDSLQIAIGKEFLWCREYIASWEEAMFFQNRV